jgi:tetratricopeptide (TPR) repeat protein
MKTLRYLLAIVLFVAVDTDLLGAPEEMNLRSASQPLEEGVPQVAVGRLQQLLRNNLGPQEKRNVLLKLSEALVGAENGEAALKVLGAPQLRNVSAAIFWQGQAFASLGLWSEALAAYDKALNAEKEPALRAAELFGKAEALRALDQKDEALRALAMLFDDQRWGLRARFRATELLLDKRDPVSAGNTLSKAQPQSVLEKQERRFLRGQIETELNHPEKALALFETILKKTEQAHHSLVIATLFAIADVHLRLKTPEAADDVLEEFIEHHPADPDLGKVYKKLDQVYQTERKPSRSELSRWSHDPAQPRRAFAQWYLARAELRAGNRAAAIADFRAFAEPIVKRPELIDGYLEFAKLQKEDHRHDDALATLDAARSMQPRAGELARINWLAAEIQYDAKRFEIAAKEFEKIAGSRSSLTNRALFNASLGWLQVSNESRFAADYQELSGGAKDDGSRGDLLLERGLLQAAQGDPKAENSLRTFLRDFAESKRVSEAWVALAEMAFHATPSRLEEARADLRHAMDSRPTAIARERADYLNIWLEDTPANIDEAKVLALANQFVRDHPASAFIPDVRMKLAEAYYRQEDFANAQTQFELLVAHNPNGPLAEKAVFFAAESAMASMATASLEHALTLFDEVVRKDGELKWAARNEQAVIERKLGKPQDALALYDEVLKGKAKPGEKREALCGKGDIYLEMGATGAENYKHAVENYDQLIAETDAPLHWRNQALFKKGVCLEKSGDQIGSLAIFYRVLENEGQPGKPREFFWFYKAGFNAARLLEEQEKWSSAAAIYQRLAVAEGMRSEEAKSRLAQLRLEHFLWDQ